MYKKGSLKSKYKHLKRMYKWTKSTKRAAVTQTWRSDALQHMLWLNLTLQIIYSCSDEIKCLWFGCKLYKIYRMFLIHSCFFGSLSPIYLHVHFGHSNKRQTKCVWRKNTVQIGSKRITTECFRACRTFGNVQGKV